MSLCGDVNISKVQQSYSMFLDQKRQHHKPSGFVSETLPDFLFPFQRTLTDWALRAGRAALFADCGLGKTPMQLAWAQEIVRRTGGRVLILTPLAVSAQTVVEGAKFDILVQRSRDGRIYEGITVTNYEQLSKFKAHDFVAVVCDESSILKSFSGTRRREITIFMRNIPYRLLCTATAAPNDHVELGTSSEALGYLGFMDMLNRYFKNEQCTSGLRRLYGKASHWRFKGHAEESFWRWVHSWARVIRRPSDLGFEDGAFVLPSLIEQEHEVAAGGMGPGDLASTFGVGLQQQREDLRRTLKERCEYAASLVAHDQPALVWCHLNVEGDLLEQLIPDGVQVAGKDSDAAKEEKLLGFADGTIRVLITKPKIGAWGLNYQHCAHVVIFPSHSFEQYYQAVRRCWRFGQKRPVVVDIVTTRGQRAVLRNLRNKMKVADEMFAHLTACVCDAEEEIIIPSGELERIPKWL